jgi:membrane fusion protein (multidrug efflux system)
MKMFRRYIYIILIVGLGAAAAYFYYSLYLKNNKEAKMAVYSDESDVVEEDVSVPVKVTKVKRDDFKNTLSYFGAIKGFRESKLRFATEGVIKEIRFKESEEVNKDEVIAVLNQEEAKTRAKYAAMEYENSKELFSLGGISKEALEKAKLQLKLAQLEVGKTVLKSSCTGVISSINFKAGEFVHPQDEIALLLDIKEVFCEIGIPEKDIPKISVGQSAQIYIDAYPLKTFHTKISSILPRMEDDTRMQIIKMKLKNDSSLLKPGMFAKADITTYFKRNALVVPTSSLKKIEGEWFMCAVNLQDKKYGSISLKKVNPGFLGYEFSHIDKGIVEGAYIIVDISSVRYSLEDNSRVEIISYIK